MTIDDVINWIMWLACSLDIRNRFLMTLVKIKYDVINQLLLSRGLTLLRFNAIACLRYYRPISLYSKNKKCVIFHWSLNFWWILRKKKEKKKKNASKCAALQLNRVQSLFSRMYRRMYNSNKFRSFTD